MKKVFILFGLIICSIKVLADDFVVDGIGYTVLSLEDKTVAVSSTTISNAVIPDYVEYKERTFSVIAINDLFDAKCKSTTLTVNSMVSELNGITFYGSGLQNIYVNERNPYFTSVDGILYDKGVTRLISFPQKKYLPEYTMPSTVKTVDEYSMGANHYLTTIIFSDAIETLPKYVFYGCTYSNSNKCVVHLPENLKTLVKSSLSDLRIREIYIPKNLTAIENGAMYFDYIENVTCASSLTPNLCISGSSTGILYNCSKLTDLYIQDEVPSSLNEGAFKEGQFMSVTLHVPSSSLEIYKSAEGWKKFWTIVDENGSSNEPSSEYSDFVVDGIGYTVLSLEDKTVAVSSTTISNAVIPDYVEYKERTFSVIAINDLFDAKCKSTTLTVNSMVSELNGITFYGSGLQNIYVNERNPYFTSVDGILYDKGVTRLISFPQKKYLPEYTMPSTVKTVDEYSMGANHYLTTIIFSDAIETLPKYVFYGCTYSNSNKCVVHLPENLKTLVKSSLSDLRIREIYIPKNLTAIENGAMYFDYIENVTCASSLTPNLCISGSSTGILYNCSKLTDLYIQDEVPSSLNEGAFKEGQFMSVTLHVPSSSLEIYKSAEGWKKFWTIVDENGNSTNINAEVQQYKDDYSYILSKTAETVTIEDQDKIDAALLAYSQLSEMAQSQLLSEKTLLDALKQKVDEIIAGVDYVTIDEYSVNIYTLSGKKVQSVQKGQFYIINSKKILIK